MEKTCSVCGQLKPATEFYKNEGRCKVCKGEATKKWRRENKTRWLKGSSEYKKAYRKAHPQEVRASDRTSYLRKSFGLTPEDVTALLSGQGCRCKLCERALNVARRRSWHIDHDHATERVRGILCSKCNNGLGFFNDNVGLFQKAIAHVSEYTTDAEYF